jgi:hypothetical protein
MAGSVEVSAVKCKEVKRFLCVNEFDNFRGSIVVSHCCYKLIADGRG